MKKKIERHLIATAHFEMCYEIQQVCMLLINKTTSGGTDIGGTFCICNVLLSIQELCKYNEKKLNAISSCKICISLTNIMQDIH